MSVVAKSRIRGNFEGWKGNGTYELENGQRWEQTRYRYRYRYKYRPKAEVIRRGGRHYLYVECMNEPIEVRRA
ncbi:hypothetical protein [Aeoliella mucimassa]|uniref:Uncharacterized protein n=1 Tax=Aeoliella mucimassa TaxID=2527972 RepID=A0A518AS32_9BACT|nr:hypothetical protein [Aeoliella mucimassa]QDU57532.1 hypothetical protein Pan181_37500 [Aeoliella mucimassa]